MLPTVQYECIAIRTFSFEFVNIANCIGRIDGSDSFDLVTRQATMPTVA